jgi:hypothetical protein
MFYQEKSGNAGTNLDKKGEAGLHLLNGGRRRLVVFRYGVDGLQNGSYDVGPEFLKVLKTSDGDRFIKYFRQKIVVFVCYF